MVAAPSSGAGKTTVTLGLLRALRRHGVALAPAKAGPDYIDPRFHEIAAGAPCVNLDPWAMSNNRLRALTDGPGTLVVEAAMGLFDGAADGTGSAADLAAVLGLPILLVVDAARQSHSVAALVHGFSTWRDDVRVAGILLNRVGSERHERMLRDALATTNVPVLGALRRDTTLTVPERHLGLVQAAENLELESLIERAADAVECGFDLSAISSLAIEADGMGASAPRPRLPPLGQRIAVARDIAFAFAYPHMLDDWHAQGAEIRPFSPLADEVPDDTCDAVFLPGGYPELHAGQLSAAERFRDGLHRARDRGALIYGECGGYMALGEVLTDADGVGHVMAGLLPAETSFADRSLHLGYRRARPLGTGPFGDVPLNGHEFHYASVVREGNPLFAVSDAQGHQLAPTGSRADRVMGSFVHVVDRAA